MSINVYRSTDASAPVLSGTVGSLITLLDACLVNGYGSQPSAGWTKAYSGTNLAAYRMITTSPATGMYLRVDDTDAQSSRFVAYKTMSGISTGTVQFPTNLQVSGGLFLRKSWTANSTARPWILIADDRSFYFIAFTNQTIFGNSDPYDEALFFGDIISNKSPDDNQCVIVSATDTSVNNQHQTLGQVNSSYTSSVGHYIAKSYTTLTESWPVSKTRRAPSGVFYTSYIGPPVTGAYPDPVTGNINLFAIEIIESNYIFRGVMPGLYEPYGGTNVGSNFDTFTGTGSLAGQTFILLPVSSGGNSGRVALRISGSWY